MKNLGHFNEESYLDFEEAALDRFDFSEKTEGSFDFKTCKKSDGTHYGIADRYECQTGVEITERPGKGLFGLGTGKQINYDTATKQGESKSARYDEIVLKTFETKKYQVSAAEFGQYYYENRDKFGISEKETVRRGVYMAVVENLAKKGMLKQKAIDAAVKLAKSDATMSDIERVPGLPKFSMVERAVIENRTALSKAGVRFI